MRMSEPVASAAGRVLFDPKGAAVLLGCSKSFLDKSRVRGDGPPFTRIGRHIRYIDADLMHWLASNRRRNTSGGLVHD